MDGPAGNLIKEVRERLLLLAENHRSCFSP